MARKIYPSMKKKFMMLEKEAWDLASAILVAREEDMSDEEWDKQGSAVVKMVEMLHSLDSDMLKLYEGERVL